MPGGRAPEWYTTLSYQGDFVLGVWLMLAPVWCMTIAEVVTAFVGVVVVHLLVNVIGLAIGARRNLL